MKVWLLVLLLLPAPSMAAETPRRGAPSTADLLGAWSGTLAHDGEDVAFMLELSPADEGRIVVAATIPVAHMAHAPMGAMTVEIDGPSVRIGPFSFAWDAAKETLSGVMPAALVPVYEMPITLHRSPKVDVPPREVPDVPRPEPLWTFDAGAPVWAGPTFAGGVVYAGTDDGRVVALDARDGRERWSFRAGGPVRTRPTAAGGVVYLQADDGMLYALDAASGSERWRVRVVHSPVVRLPFSDPASRYDRFGSDVVVVGDRLYLGTHDGHVLALRAGDGGTIWDHEAAQSVLAAPAVDADRVYFGSYDGHVTALGAATGDVAWTRDTRGAVVSTPALADGRVIVGNRAYDLLGLEAATGDVAWKRYIWFSWVESSATVEDGVAYVGSSDAAGVFAFAVASGDRLWAADVLGWSWGQPLVTADRVFVGTSSTRGYMADHAGGVLALERASGRVVWRYPAREPESGAFGFPGSLARGDGLVFAGGLDGRLYAFAGR